MLLFQFLVAITLFLPPITVSGQAHPHPHPLHRRMVAHYQDENWLDSVQEEQFHENGTLNRAARRAQPDVACVPYASGNIAKQAFKDHFHHVETIHADKPTDRTCFLLVKNLMAAAPDKGIEIDIDPNPNVEDQRLAELASQVGATSWHTLDPALKLDPSALMHASDVTGFEKIAKSHRDSRLRRSTSAREVEYWFKVSLEIPLMKNEEKHEYEIQVTLMPGKASTSVQESVNSILEHLHNPVDEPTERALLDSLSAKYSANTAIWKAGHACLDEIKSQAQERTQTRNLQGSPSVRSHSPGVSSTGLNYRKISEISPLGFKMSSVGLQGGRRLDTVTSTPVLSRECHVYLYAKLVEHPAVLNVAVTQKMRILNDVSKSLFQSNTQQAGGGNAATAWPYAAAGLDGTGQVVIVCDTGLDTDHCHFRENAGTSKVFPQKMVSKEQSFGYDLLKRKVIQYIYWYASDTDDYNGGHGTHMASSSCGSSVDNSNPQFNGMAPKAKLAFWDIGDAQGGLSMPADMTLMFIPGRAAGAHIFSGSWGSTENMNSQYVTILDGYSYSSDSEFLAVFAAGNEGQEGYFSVGEPAFAKNALSVGAHESNWNLADQTLSDTVRWRRADQTNMAYFSSMGPTYDFRIKPDIASPGMFVNAANAAGASSCGFKSEAGTSSATALTSGIAVLIRQYYMDSSFHQAATSPSVPAFTPSGALVKATIIHAGQQMLKYFPNPTNPGYSTSGYTTEVKLGTVLRGPYVSGSHEDSDADLPQVGDSYKPGFISGFGRVNLQNALPLPGVTNRPFDLHAYDSVSVTSNTQYSWFVQTPATGTWLASPGAEAGEAILKATLVWMDPPVYPFVDKNMVHDLDLVITEVASPSTNFPEPTAADPIWLGNGGAYADSTNNVEQITITTLTRKGQTGLKLNTFYRVSVRANVLTEAASQKFSLVVTTPKTNTHASTVTAPDYKNTDASPVIANQGIDAIENICASNELELEITLSSHLAIGWQGGDQYTLTSNAGTPSFSHIGTMNATQAISQLIKTDVVCLPVGSYFIKLDEITNTASTVPRDRFKSLGQTALDVNDCYVHLQGQYTRRNATMVISSEDGVLKCNYCNPEKDLEGIKHYPVQVLLYGSVYGGRLSYGWQNETSYTLWQNNKRVAWNTLNQGIIGTHRYCLAEGPYSVGYSTWSNDDDFDSRNTASNDFVSGVYGITEYSMGIYGCQDTAVLLKKVDAWVVQRQGNDAYWVKNTNFYASLTNTYDPAYCTVKSSRSTPADESGTKMSPFIVIAISAVAGLLLIGGASYAFNTYCAQDESHIPRSHNEHVLVAVAASAVSSADGVAPAAISSSAHKTRGRVVNPRGVGARGEEYNSIEMIGRDDVRSL